MSRIDINDLSKEKLVDIVKQLRHQLRDSERASSLERIAELEGQVAGLQDLIQEKNTELRALRHQGAMLSEKSVSDEETISALIRQLEGQTEVLHSTKLEAAGTPSGRGAVSPDGNRGSAPSVGSSALTQAKGELSLSAKVASLHSQLAASSNVLKKKNEVIAKLEGNVRELMEVNAFYAAIVSQHDEEAKARQQATPVAKEDSLSEACDVARLMKRIGVLEDHRDRFQLIVQQLEKERKQLLLDNEMLTKEVNRMRVEVMETARWYRGMKATLSTQTFSQGSECENSLSTSWEPSALPERVAAHIMTSPDSSARQGRMLASPLSKGTALSAPKTTNAQASLRALPPFTIRNPTPREKELLDRLYLYERTMKQQETFEADRQSSFDTMERTRADLFATLNHQLEQQRKEIQALRRRQLPVLEEPCGPSVSERREALGCRSMATSPVRIQPVSAEFGLSEEDCDLPAPDVRDFTSRINDIAREETTVRSSLCSEETFDCITVAVAMYHSLEIAAAATVEVLLSQTSDTNGRLENALRELRNRHPEVQQDEAAVQMMITVDTLNAGNTTLLRSTPNCVPEMLTPCYESKTSVALQTLMSLYGESLLAFAHANRPTVEGQDVQVLATHTDFDLEEVKEALHRIGANHTPIGPALIPAAVPQKTSHDILGSLFENSAAPVATEVDGPSTASPTEVPVSGFLHMGTPNGSRERPQEDPTAGCSGIPSCEEDYEEEREVPPRTAPLISVHSEEASANSSSHDDDDDHVSYVKVISRADHPSDVPEGPVNDIHLEPYEDVEEVGSVEEAELLWQLERAISYENLKALPLHTPSKDSASARGTASTASVGEVENARRDMSDFSNEKESARSQMTPTLPHQENTQHSGVSSYGGSDSEVAPLSSRCDFPVVSSRADSAAHTTQPEAARVSPGGAPELGSVGYEPTAMGAPHALDSHRASVPQTAELRKSTTVFYDGRVDAIPLPPPLPPLEQPELPPALADTPPLSVPRIVAAALSSYITATSNSTNWVKVADCSEDDDDDAFEAEFNPF